MVIKTDDLVRIGNKDLSLYMRYALTLLESNNIIRLQAFGNSISKAIYLAEFIKINCDGNYMYVETGVENNVTTYKAKIVCNEDTIKKLVSTKHLNSCKICNKTIITNGLYKDVDIYCDNHRK